MAKNNLCLIGTNHLDIDGPKRLEGLLGSFSPDIISLEYHKERDSFMLDKQSKASPEELEKQTKRIFEEVRMPLTPKQLKVILASSNVLNSTYGYELRVSKEYADLNGRRLEYIDISVFDNGTTDFSRGLLDMMKVMMREVSEIPELRRHFLKGLNNGLDKYLQGLRAGIAAQYDLEQIENFANSLKDPAVLEGMREVSAEAYQVAVQIYNPKRDNSMAKKIRRLHNRGSKKVAVVAGTYHLPGLKKRLLNLNPSVRTLADFKD